MDSYRIPTKSGASEYVDKRSRFLGLVRPVGSEDEARTIIAACKKQYHDARHNCWCYLLRDGTERYSDDGEPQGTAGIPMLEVFRRAGVTNVVCVVTRYFGGILLGVIESLGAGYIGSLTGGFLGSHYQDIFAFAVLILVLVFRPSGLMGERVAERA